MFKKENILFGGTIIAIIATVFSLYYLSLNQVHTVSLPESHKPKPIPSSEMISPEQATTSPSPAGTIDLSPSAIANWPTCRNEKYGYEFKYPKGWYLHKLVEGSHDEYPEATNVCDAKGIVVSQHPTMSGSFSPLYLHVSVTTVDVWESIKETTGKIITKEDMVNGEKIKYISKIGFSSAAFFRGEKAFIFGLRDYIRYYTKDERLPSLSLSYDTPEQKLLRAILSTFKFID